MEFRKIFDRGENTAAKKTKQDKNEERQLRREKEEKERVQRSIDKELIKKKEQKDIIERKIRRIGDGVYSIKVRLNLWDSRDKTNTEDKYTDLSEKCIAKLIREHDGAPPVHVRTIVIPDEHAHMYQTISTIVIFDERNKTKNGEVEEEKREKTYPGLIE